MKKEAIREAKAEAVISEEAHAQVVLAQERSMDKKIVLPEDLAECIDNGFDSEIITTEALRKFPALRDMPPRPQVVLGAMALGFSQQYIAKAFGISKQAIGKMQKRYDPHRAYALSPEAKKAFMTRLVESKALDAIGSITQEKLDESSAKDLTVIGKNLNDINMSMNASKHKAKTFSNIDAFLENVEEAEVIEG